MASPGEAPPPGRYGPPYGASGVADGTGYAVRGGHGARRPVTETVGPVTENTGNTDGSAATAVAPLARTLDRTPAAGS